MKENFLSRSRKFNPQNFFLSILNLATSTNSQGYWSALHKTWSKSGLNLEKTPVKSSLAEYREKVSSEFFKDIWQEDLQRMQSHRKRWRGLYVYSVDGDHLELPASKDVFERGFRGYTVSSNRETHYPKMYTVQAVDVMNGLIKKFSFSEKVSEIYQARNLIDSYERKSLTIYDRLHFSHQTALLHTKARNHYLIRVPFKGTRSHLQVREFVGKKKSSKWIDFLHLPHKKTGRQNESIRARLIKVKNPKTKELIVFMTNLPERFSVEEISELYQRRWDIETSFRDLTSTLKMNQWHSTKLNGVLQEIYTLFWLVNQVRFQCSRSFKEKDWLKSVYCKPNFKLCMELVMDHLELLIQRKYQKLCQIIDFWIKRSSEKREHLSRTYPRQVRRHGKKYKNASATQKRD